MTGRAIVAEFYRARNGLTLHAITVIEDKTSHDGGRVYRSKRYYDVDWSRTYASYIFHESGGGGGEPVDISGLYYVSGEAEVRPGPTQWCGYQGKRSGPNSTKEIRKRNRTRRLNVPPRGIDLEPGQDILDWLERHAFEQKAVFCATCRDSLPDEHLCEHIWWCDKIGWYSTPTEPCGHTREECEQ